MHNLGNILNFTFDEARKCRCTAQFNFDVQITYPDLFIEIASFEICLNVHSREAAELI
jgi:hypothetical protein